MKSHNPLPKYAWISFIAFLCAGMALSVLVANAENLSKFRLTQQVYYLVLVCDGLMAAVFLFGVLDSSAMWEGRALGGTLKLSGPIIAAALVVFGGHFFLPRPTYFPLTVYVHGEGGSRDIVVASTGRVFLKLGPEIVSESIMENGQAVFPRISADLSGRQVPAWVESDSFEAVRSAITLAGTDVDLVVKKKIKRFRLAGRVSKDREEPLSNVRIELPEYRQETRTDTYGRFEIEVIADRQQPTDLVAEKPGYRSENLRATLGDSSLNFRLERTHQGSH